MTDEPVSKRPLRLLKPPTPTTIMPNKRMALLTCLAATLGVAASTFTSACSPSPATEDGAPCPACCGSLQQLPLDEWSAQRSTATSYQFHWGQGEMGGTALLHAAWEHAAARHGDSPC